MRYEVLITGESIAEWKIGVQAIWTGFGLPTAHMNYFERLGLNENASLKAIKRAYYQKSLEWHPDRWSNMHIYHVQVQMIFELVSEAYQGLTKNE